MISSLQARDARLIWHPFTSTHQTPVLPVKAAEGARLQLADGRELIDGISSWWVINHGHGQPEIIAAVEAQLNKLEQVIFAGFTHEPAIELAEALEQLLGPERYWFFFSDDGSTAVEVALKISIQYHYLKGESRNRFIALEDAYHGDTFGAMAASARSLFTRPFDSHLCQVTHLPRPKIDTLDSWLEQAFREIESGDVVAFIFEPGLQGAGGMRIFDLNLLAPLVKACRAQEILIIADEVLTGFGRTGELVPSLVHEPDLICFSKGLTGGFLPLGLTAIRRPIRETFNQSRETAFFHGHSFTGNPLACAAAVASLNLFQHGYWYHHVNRIGSAHHAFCQKLSSCPVVHYPRVVGSILAFDLDNANNYLNPIGPKIYDWCLRHDVLLRPLGQVVYFMPPFCISDADLNQVYDVIWEGLSCDWNA